MIDSYKKLSIRKYMDICEISQSDMEEVDKQVEILAILADKTTEEVLALPIAEYQKLVLGSLFLSKDVDKPTSHICKEYKLGGLTLKPIKDVGSMSAAQYIDFQVLTKEQSNAFPAIASIFLIPKGCKYNSGYDIMEVQDAIAENMSIVDMDNLFTFFLQRFISSMQSTLTYSNWIVRRMNNTEKKRETMQKIEETKQALRQGSDGLRMLMQLPRPADAVGMLSGKKA